MSQSINHRTIYNSMQQDYDLCVKMLEKLELEKLALETSDSDLLQKTMQEKITLLKELAEIQHVRDHTLEVLGFNAGFSGLKALLANDQIPAAAEQLTLLQNLEEILHKITKASNLNASLIYSNIHQTNKILDVMLDRKKHNITYGKHGFASTNSNNPNSTTKV